MKKAILAGLFLGMTQVGMAGEHSGNPDRFPSIGLNYTGTALSGDGTVMASGVSAKQDEDLVMGEFMVDGRFPVSDWITLSAGLGLIGYEFKGEETALLAGGKDELSGVKVNLGIRWYIH